MSHWLPAWQPARPPLSHTPSYQHYHTAIATELEIIKSRLPTSSVTSFAQRQCLLDIMDNRLRRVVEPQLRAGDTWLTMVETAERYDATLFKTGAYGRCYNSGS